MTALYGLSGIIFHSTLSTGVWESRKEMVSRKEKWGLQCMILPSCNVILRTCPDVVGFLFPEWFSANWWQNLCLNTTHGKWWVEKRQLNKKSQCSGFSFSIQITVYSARVPECKIAFNVLPLIWLGRIKVMSVYVRLNTTSFACLTNKELIWCCWLCHLCQIS